MSWKIKSRIESFDVQPNGNVKISALLKLFQKAAGDELLDTPFSFFNLARRNVAFVLTKMTLKIIKDIKIYDELEIITHPRKIHGATYPRDFIVKVGGETVAVARSMWVLLDIENRHILRPSAIADLGEIPTSEADLFEIEDVRRIVDQASLLRTDVRDVKYSNLDMNNHLNNTYYSDFVFDCFNHNERTSDAGLYLQINYKNEARLGDVLEISSNVDSSDADAWDFSACCQGTDKICFTAFIKYQ
ncbi:MAG: hypothetical protein J6K12_01685 [Clostridia bacterium]|nr:hypothetical protein [Clostridia bacterium]